MCSIDVLTALNLNEIVTPTLLINLDVCKRNADNMREKCRQLGVNLRPHMKTHKTLELAELMTDGTKRCITVSTLTEAEHYADAGYDDILIAVTFTAVKIPRMRQLANRLKSFHVMIDSHTALDILLANSLSDNRKWSVFLKVDCGYHRAGVEWDSEDGVILAKRICAEDGITFQGIYTHDGDSYGASGEEQLQQAGSSAADKLIAFSQRLTADGTPCPVVATGSTPSCSKPGPSMAKLTEFHPGNYILYDAQQMQIGSCKQSDVGCVVATRIIGRFPQRNQLLVDCGWTALSLDGKGALPGKSFCFFVGESNLSLKKMTQETGTVEAIEGGIDFDKFSIGCMLFLIPYHACATATMHSTYHVYSNKKFVGQYHPCRGW